MPADRVSVDVDTTEPMEAVAVFRQWLDRIEELPTHLKHELIRVASLPASELLWPERHGGHIVMTIAPEARAILANLRARA